MKKADKIMAVIGCVSFFLGVIFLVLGFVVSVGTFRKDVEKAYYSYSEKYLNENDESTDFELNDLLLQQ